MTRATRCAEYTPCLYLAFELGSDAWRLGFTTELGATPRVRTMPARDLARLTREIAAAKQWFGVQAATPVQSCYEAGRDGFWRHRYLTAGGIENVVVDSSSIEVNRRLRRAKSDGLDARSCSGCGCGSTRASATCGAWGECPRWRRRIHASCIASSGP
jgi:hypothetical protein